MQHLQECRACQQEWEIVRAAGGLGRRQVVIDTEAVAASVMGRLRKEPRTPLVHRGTWAAAGLAAAAAIIVAMWAGNVENPTATTSDSNSIATAQLEIPLPELEILQATDLDTVLQAMDEPNNLRELGEDEPGLSDLNSDELQRVLDTWEG